MICTVFAPVSWVFGVRSKFWMLKKGEMLYFTTLPNLFETRLRVRIPRRLKTHGWNDCQIYWTVTSDCVALHIRALTVSPLVGWYWPYENPNHRWRDEWHSSRARQRQGLPDCFQVKTLALTDHHLPRKIATLSGWRCVVPPPGFHSFLSYCFLWMCATVIAGKKNQICMFHRNTVKTELWNSLKQQ